MSKQYRADFAGPGIMIISAAIFGFFGFVMQFSATGINGTFLIYIPMLVWTMRVSSVVFLLAGVLTVKAPLPGNLIYAVAGVLGAIMFVIIAIMDLLDTQHTIMSYAPVILFLFAAFNGYGSWQGIRAVMEALRQERSAAPPQAT